jgi:putative ABC transport system substrate-binding protein
MDRRHFVATVAGALAVVPASARAQQSTRMWRIGALATGAGGASGRTFPGAVTNPPSATLRQALQDYGYVEGKNVTYVSRSAEGRIERLPTAAAELVALGVDVILTSGSEATRAAKQATTTIPIVFLGPSYPVEEGLIASFARPGGNITGITVAQSDHVSKHLQLLRDVAPQLADVAVFWSRANPGNAFTLRDIESAAAPMKIKVQSVAIASVEGAEEGLGVIDRMRPGALILLPSPLVYPYAPRIAELAIRLRIPTITAFKQFAEQGFLLSYGADIRELEPRVAGYVDRILRGAKPAELPVERPTKFELAINMKTAKAIGVAIPQALLLRADHKIE